MVSPGRSRSQELGRYCRMEVIAHDQIRLLYSNQLWLKSGHSKEVNYHDLSQALISPWWVHGEVSIATEEVLIWFHFLEECLHIDFVRNVPKLQISDFERIPSINCATWIASFVLGAEIYLLKIGGFFLA
jgi:hypothetical protein